MNNKLVELFNLDNTEPVNLDPAAAAEIAGDSEAMQALKTTVNNMDKIDAALPQVLGLEASEKEMDDIAQMATEGYQQLMELGMNVETRHAAEVFGAASNMLGHALTAKKNKLEKKLKMIELQLKKAALDQKVEAKNEEVGATPIGEGRALDRNELLKILTAKKDEQ